jgi:hypothetical protein
VSAPAACIGDTLRSGRSLLHSTDPGSFPVANHCVKVGRYLICVVALGLAGGACVHDSLNLTAVLIRAWNEFSSISSPS